MKKLSFGILAVIALMGSMFAQTCSSAAPTSKEWKPLSTAPKDGTIVEVVNTYGVAPMYGMFKWNRSYKSWMSASDPNMGLAGEECNYWRPYKGLPDKYIDPTGGAQNSVKYWCAAIHAKYNAKKDACYTEPDVARKEKGSKRA